MRKESHPPAKTPSDPFQFYDTCQCLVAAWGQDPARLAQITGEYNQKMDALSSQALDLLPIDSRLSSTADARRHWLQQTRKAAGWARKCHRTAGAYLKTLVDQAPDLDANVRRRAAFWIGQMISQTAPANHFWTNPAAVSRWLESDGVSLEKGMQQWRHDILSDSALMPLCDDKAFELGKTLAATPGQVVFRNELVELIQYTPVTQTVYHRPLVFIQPWINKYYIFDLSRRNSFVRFMLAEGFQVFITSWKNPDGAMREIGFENYLFDGVLASIETVRQLCKCNQVHAAGYCIGGTALATLMAWLNRTPAARAHCPIADWTLFAAMVDFSDPGTLAVFTSEPVIEWLESLMETSGFLDQRLIDLGFRMLKPDQLLWRAFNSHYLQGMPRPKSDMLFWNQDGTRLAQAMCSDYLRRFYLHNQLAQPGHMKIRGHALHLDRIRQPLYAVGGQRDHICPWTGTFAAGRLTGGPARYILTHEGHITSIVYPPAEGAKQSHLAVDIDSTTAAKDLPSSNNWQKDSWWRNWADWLRHRHDTRKPAPSHQRLQRNTLGRAPGKYVMDK